MVREVLSLHRTVTGTERVSVISSLVISDHCLHMALIACSASQTTGLWSRVLTHIKAFSVPSRGKPHRVHPAVQKGTSLDARHIRIACISRSEQSETKMELHGL